MTMLQTNRNEYPFIAIQCSKKGPEVLGCFEPAVKPSIIVAHGPDYDVRKPFSRPHFTFMRSLSPRRIYPIPRLMTRDASLTSKSWSWLASITKKEKNEHGHKKKYDQFIFLLFNVFFFFLV